MNSRLRTMAAAGAMLLACGGCSKKLVVTYYPTFYDQQLRTVAVLPLAGRTGDAGGLMVADRIIDALVDKGTYEVVSGPALLKRLSEAGYGSAPTTAPARHYTDDKTGTAGREALLAALRKVGGIDAVLVGRVERFDAGSYTVRHLDYYPSHYYYGYGYRHYGYYRHAYGGGYGGGYYGVSYTHHNRADVAATTELIRVSDGRRLETLTEAVAIRSSGGRPDLSPKDCLETATSEVARRFVRDLTPSPREIQIKPGDTVKTARRYGAGRTFTDSFRADDATVLLVVRLPRPCERNRFDLAVTGKDKASPPLLELPLTWQGGDRERTLEVPIADLAVPAGSEREFHVLFSHAGRVIFDRKFKVKQ